MVTDVGIGSVPYRVAAQHLEGQSSCREQSACRQDIEPPLVGPCGAVVFVPARFALNQGNGWLTKHVEVDEIRQGPAAACMGFAELIMTPNRRDEQLRLPNPAGLEERGTYCWWSRGGRGEGDRGLE
jgi:hypothetical protein